VGVLCRQAGRHPGAPRAAQHWAPACACHQLLHPAEASASLPALPRPPADAHPPCTRTRTRTRTRRRACRSPRGSCASSWPWPRSSCSWPTGPMPPSGTASSSWRGSWAPAAASCSRRWPRWRRSSRRRGSWRRWAGVPGACRAVGRAAHYAREPGLLPWGRRGAWAAAGAGVQGGSELGLRRRRRCPPSPPSPTPPHPLRAVRRQRPGCCCGAAGRGHPAPGRAQPAAGAAGGGGEPGRRAGQRDGAAEGAAGGGGGIGFGEERGPAGEQRALIPGVPRLWAVGVWVCGCAWIGGVVAAPLVRCR
jgi:hypothetical protein